MVDTHEQLRGYVEYLRDLGVYDLYRLGPPAIPVQPATRPPQLVATGILASPIVPLPESAKPYGLSCLDYPPSRTTRREERPLALAAIQTEIGDCTRCPLAYGGRRRVVFGNGDPSANLMLVGEGPGADEDTTGEPFVGKAGKLLDNMIAAMGLRRDQVYVTDMVKCRPPNDRVPEPVEANTCAQFLVRQIDIVRPKVIVALGATAALYLLGVKEPLTSLRGVWHECRGAKLIVTYPPAFLLRDPRQKGEAWKDLQRVMAELGLEAPKRPS